MIGFHRIYGMNWLNAVAEPDDSTQVVKIRNKKYIPVENGLMPIKLANHWNKVRTILLINKKSA